MDAFWKWVNENAGALGLFIAALPVLWAAWRYLSQKRQELRDRRFETYHDLIKQLVEREDPKTRKRLDRQLAVVFELRRFKEYYEPTFRILTGLREDWKDSYGPEDKRQRLLEEMDATIQYIESKKPFRARPER